MGNGTSVSLFVNLTLDGGEWSALPREKRSSIHCTRGWVGLEAGMYVKEKGKISFPYQNSNSDPRVVHPAIAVQTELPGSHTVLIRMKLLNKFTSSANKTGLELNCRNRRTR
jgi:hypothetical protein